MDNIKAQSRFTLKKFAWINRMDAIICINPMVYTLLYLFTPTDIISLSASLHMGLQQYNKGKQGDRVII